MDPTLSSDTILLPSALTGVARGLELATFDSKAQDVYFQGLFRAGGGPTRIDGTRAFWYQQKYSRALAPVTGMTSPGAETANVERSAKDSALIAVKFYRDIAWPELFINSGPGPIGLLEMRRDAKSRIDPEIKDMVNEANRTREFFAAMALRDGGIAFTNALIAGSKSPPFTVDYGVGTLSAAHNWSEGATPIVSEEFDLIQAAGISAAGIPAKRLVIGRGVGTNIRKNAEALKYVPNTQLGKQFLEATAAPATAARQLIAGLRLGDMLVDVNPYGYQQPGSAFVPWVEDDHAIALPEDLAGILAWAEASHPVPSTSIAPGSGPLLDMPSGPGLVAWSELLPGAAGVRLYMAGFFLPIVAFPEAVIDVTTEI